MKKLKIYCYMDYQKKDNFYLKIWDKFFNKLINNPYFKANLNIEIEDIPEYY